MIPRAETWKRAMDGTAQETHITLVHGTCARGARWTRQGSLLRQTLEEAFPGRVHFHDDFRWSGLPSHIARHVAGKRLQAYLWNVTEEHTGSHYVIGHSYGTLVLLYALRDPALAKRVAGVVSLSTPYLVARRRQLSVLGRVAAAISYFWLIFLIAWWPLRGDPNDPPGSIFNDAPTVGTFLIVGGLLLALVYLVEAMDPLTKWFLTTLAIPEIHPKRFLIVRGPSDEASALISLLHALELLVTVVWGRRGLSTVSLRRKPQN